MAKMELTGTDVIQLVNQIGDQEKHFNGLETQYRLLASTWLLASLGAIGFLLKDDKSPWLDTNKLYLIGLIGIVGSLGIILLWILDIKVYHKLLHSVFIRGILLELQYPWLPKLRTDMLLSVETGDITRNTGLYYIGSAVFLQLIALLSFIRGTSGTLNKIGILLTGLLLITGVVIYMRRSNISDRARRLYEILKEDYKDDIDLALTAGKEDTATPDNNAPNFQEKFKTRIKFLNAGFNHPPTLLTIDKGSLNKELEVAETNQWWYCLEGAGVMRVETTSEKRDYFLQSNCIVPVEKGVKFKITNNSQLPLEVAVFKQ